MIHPLLEKLEKYCSFLIREAMEEKAYKASKQQYMDKNNDKKKLSSLFYVPSCFKNLSMRGYITSL